jgi:AbrB family looped-hinge helix DNA binding protein
LSNKGQIVIPHRIRKQHGWEAGVEFTVESDGPAITLRPVTTFTATPVAEAYGCLHWRGRKRTLEDIDKAIRKGARKQR